MGQMTCVECGKSWTERGFSVNTICDDCQEKRKKESITSSDDFQSIVYKILLDEEIEALGDIDWDELKLIAAEYVALQLRWKLLKIKKGRVE